jgi:hypothetical protein
VRGEAFVQAIEVWGLPEFHSGTGAMRVHADVDCHTTLYQDINVCPETT